MNKLIIILAALAALAAPAQADTVQPLTAQTLQTQMLNEPSAPAKFKYIQGKAAIEQFFSNPTGYFYASNIFESGPSDRKVYTKGLSINFGDDKTLSRWNAPGARITGYLYIDEDGQWSISIASVGAVAGLNVDGQEILPLEGNVPVSGNMVTIGVSNRSVTVKMGKGWHRFILSVAGGRGTGTAGVSLLGPSEFDARRVTADLTYLRIENPDYDEEVKQYNEAITKWKEQQGPAKK